jgi:galactokinase
VASVASPSAELPSPVRELLTRLKSANPPVLTTPTPAHPDLSVARAPGRLDVMGGIADYTGSLVCELPIDCAAAVAVQRRDDHRIVIQTFNQDVNGGAERRVELSMDDFYGTAALLPVETLQGLFSGPRHWAAYFAGAFPVLAKQKKMTRRTTGVNIACYSTVPIGAGLASSAAVTCAALSALTAAFHVVLEPLEIAVLAQKIEQQMAGAPCGIMDQTTAMLGRKDHLLLLRCQPHEVEGYASIPDGMMFAGIRSGVKHSVNGAGYRRARVSAFIAQAMIARMYVDLGMKKDPTRGYLANVTPEMLDKYFRAILPERISGNAFTEAHGALTDRATTVAAGETYYPRAAAEHHVGENQRVQAFAGLIGEMGKARNAAARNELAVRAGALMRESHQSYSVNAHLGTSETDLLVELVMQRGADAGFYGAKITGGGEGGTVAVMAEESDRIRAGLAEICAEYEQRTGLKPELVTGSSAGAAETGVLRIPVSGL